jgi:murein L,D-transpeptidase YcbB/YkuD
MMIAFTVVACGGFSGSEEGTSRGPKSANVDTLRVFEQRLGRLLNQEAYRRARNTALKDTVEGELLEESSLHHPGLVGRMYADRGYQPVWYRGFDEQFEIVEPAFDLSEQLVDAVRSHGLWPEQVHFDEVQELGKGGLHCCDGWAEVQLTSDQREAILAHLADRERALAPSDNLRWLASLVASPEGPTPELADQVSRRAESLTESTAKLARREVLLTDGLVEFLSEMRYANPAWHQPRAWRATLRVGDRGPIRSTTLAGDQKEKTAAGAMRRAIQQARTRALLAEVIGEVFAEPETVDQAMRKAIPPYRQYRRLVGAFQRYRPIVERGGWPELPGSALELEVGDVSRDVRVLKERLRVEGYWNPTGEEEDGEVVSFAAAAAAASSSEVVEEGAAATPGPPNRDEREHSMVFDERLEEAVTAYQKTHQLWEHGSVTPETLRSLNKPAAQRWNQIRLALQRWRESNIGADSHYIHVNIPDFHAEVWRDGDRKMRIRAIVGQATEKENEETGEVRYPRATPIFSDELDYLVLNPYWNVPESIRENELKPKLEENPDYYEEEGFEVVVDDNGYEFVRQKPGPDNALGKVKFLFPNSHSVYMHDTPTESLFDKPRRAYSHGCIRLQKPLELMHYLLDLDGRWTGEERKKQLEEWFSKDTEKWLSLRKSVPVHLEYYVVRVGDKGHANFLSDLYGHDAPRITAIEKRLSRYPDGYDLPVPDGMELMDAALDGTLNAERDL